MNNYNNVNVGDRYKSFLPKEFFFDQHLEQIKLIVFGHFAALSRWKPIKMVSQNRTKWKDCFGDTETRTRRGKMIYNQMGWLTERCCVCVCVCVGVCCQGNWKVTIERNPILNYRIPSVWNKNSILSSKFRSYSRQWRTRSVIQTRNGKQIEPNLVECVLKSLEGSQKSLITIASNSSWYYRGGRARRTSCCRLLIR